MKNTLKRALLLIPVISVLLVALAVPAFAEATDGGSVAPFTFEACKYYYGDSVLESDVSLNAVGSFEGGRTYQFSYLLDVDVASLSEANFNIWNKKFVVNLSFTNGDVHTYFANSVECNGERFKYSVYNADSGSSPVQGGYLDSLESLQILVEDDPLMFSKYFDYTYYVVAPSTVDGFTSVWTEIMIWITSALTSVMGAFYVDGSLTLLGTLAVIGVSVGIGFLLIGLIQRFLHLRG